MTNRGYNFFLRLTFLRLWLKTLILSRFTANGLTPLRRLQRQRANYISLLVLQTH